jgi:hypothetical protein
MSSFIPSKLAHTGDHCTLHMVAPTKCTLNVTNVTMCTYCWNRTLVYPPTSMLLGHKVPLKCEKCAYMVAFNLFEQTGPRIISPITCVKLVPSDSKQDPE